MKRLYILSAFIFFAISSKGATASFMFLNNNINATSLDLEIRVKSVDTVFVRVNGINYLNATTKLTIPSSTLLKLTFFNAGTSTSFFISDNAVFNDNDFNLGTLTGSSTSKGYHLTTAY